jgi:hypothetical protein
MNYDQVSYTEEEELQPVTVIQPRGLDTKHKIFYTCLGIFITAKVLLVCWIFTLSFPSDSLARLFHW